MQLAGEEGRSTGGVELKGGIKLSIRCTQGVCGILIITAGQPKASKWGNVRGAQDWGLGIRTQIARSKKRRRSKVGGGQLKFPV